jgi:hypothetical protein
MKNLLITVIFLSIPHVAHAEPESSIALKGGLNAATLDHDNRENREGFSGGIAGYLQWLLSERFSLGGQVELLYTPRGAEVVVGGQTQGESREHYVDFVVAARPGIRLGPVSIYLLLGGSLDLLISANKDNILGSREDITGDLHRIDIALLAGAGVALHLPGQSLGPFQFGTVFLEARHDIGLIDTDLANDGFKNRSSSLMLGLSFVVGGASAPAPAPTSQAADLQGERSAWHR